MKGYVAVDIVASFSQRGRGVAQHADALRQPAPPTGSRDPVEDHQRGLTSLHHVTAEGTITHGSLTADYHLLFSDISIISIISRDFE